MVSIARKNLFHDLPRFIVAQAGITFAVGLVTIQTGILRGFTRSTSLLVDTATADIWVASEDMRHLDLTLPIPYERVEQALEVEGVERAEPLIIRGSVWRQGSNKISPVDIVGLDAEGELFRPTPMLQGDFSDFEQPYTIAVDQTDLSALDVNEIGDSAQIGALDAQIQGVTSGMRSIISSPFVFTSLTNARAFLDSRNFAPTNVPSTPPQLTPTSPISFVLIQAQPEQDLETLKQNLEEALPGVRAVTQTELSEITQTHWQNSTGVGFILSLGAVVGIVVGTVVVSQILYSSVTDHIKEFGTLKAMGSPDRFLYRVILEQALWMAVAGYIPGMTLCLVLSSWALRAQAVQILISPLMASGIFVLTLGMCSGAAIFAIQKVTRLDPAMVFKS